MSESPIIVALDFSSAKQAEALLEQLSPKSCRVKIGLEMFTLYGADFVKQVQAKGFEVFLDLKFHDIPNTVAHTVAAAADLGVWMLNVHASGGVRMMEAAKEALVKHGANAPLLIAVTVLTSMEQQDINEIGLKLSIPEYAERLAILTKQCGLDGVVCSAHEVQRFRTRLGNDFLLVTPGIRPVGVTADDQRRIMTPQRAKAAGVDYLVIGRPITQASDPKLVVQEIIRSLQ